MRASPFPDRLSEPLSSTRLCARHLCFCAAADWQTPRAGRSRRSRPCLDTYNSARLRGGCGYGCSLPGPRRAAASRRRVKCCCCCSIIGRRCRCSRLRLRALPSGMRPQHAWTRSQHRLTARRRRGRRWERAIEGPWRQADSRVSGVVGSSTGDDRRIRGPAG